MEPSPPSFGSATATAVGRYFASRSHRLLLLRPFEPLCRDRARPRCGFPVDREAFLDRFAEAGFYLDDLSPHRGDKPAQRSSEPDVVAGVRRLSGIVDREGPVLVLGVLLRIRDLVANVVAGSQRPTTPCQCIPFPNPKSDRDVTLYQAALRDVLLEFGCS